MRGKGTSRSIRYDKKADGRFRGVTDRIPRSPVGGAEPDEQSNTQRRLTGRIEYVLMGISTTSILSGWDPDDYLGLDDDFSVIDSLGSHHEYSNMATTFLLFDLNYLLNDTTSIYLGSPFFDDDREGLTAGVQKLFSDYSLLDASLFFGADELWEDPYLLGEKRKNTLAAYAGCDVDYDNIMDSGWYINYMFQFHMLEEDVSGDAEKDLRRDGPTHTFKAGYHHYLTERLDMVLTPSLIFVRDNRKGDAYANTGWGGQVNFTMDGEKNAFTFIGIAQAARFDGIHPYFGKTREDMAYTVECYYTRRRLWNRGWYLRVGAGAYHLRSNIGFFDETCILYGISLGYAFE